MCVSYIYPKCLPFGRTRVKILFLVGFVFLNLFFLCNVLHIIICPFVPFLFVIVLSVHLRFMASDFAVGIFNIFLLVSIVICAQPDLRHVVNVYTTAHEKTIKCFNTCVVTF